MKKLFPKTVAALLSFTCMGSIMTTSFNGTPLFTTRLIADAEESSCVSFDEETGTLTLSGQVESNCLYSYRNSKKVKRVEASEGTVLPEDSTRLFTYILADTIDLSKADTSKVKYANLMFDHCSNIKSLDLSSFNTSNITSMTLMFQYCRALESIDLYSFDTRNVEHMDYMFYCCHNLKSLDLSNFKTNKVVTMHDMFAGCWALEELDLSSFDTTNVQGMGRMFTNCSNLKSVNLSSFDTSKVTNMGYMFYYCSSLEALNLNNFDTSNVTGMEYMFSNCSSLKSLDLSSFDTSNVKNMDHMFTSCSRLGELNLSSFNTSKIDNMRGMFQLCESLKSLNLSSFDTKNVKSMQNMFSECTSLKSIFVSDKWSTDSVVISDKMFYNCSNLKGISTVFDPAYIDHKRACIDTFLTPGYLRSSKANINDGIYIFESAVAPNMMADVDINEANGESNLRLLNRNDSSAQKFSITSTGNENYTIRLANNKDKALTAKGNTAGSNVVASQYNANDRQIWHFEYADDGYYYIRSKTGYYLDVSGGFSQNNTNIQLYLGNGSDAQRWKLIKIKNAENPSDNDPSQNEAPDQSEPSTENNEKPAAEDTVSNYKYLYVAKLLKTTEVKSGPNDAEQTLILLNSENWVDIYEEQNGYGRIAPNTDQWIAIKNDNIKKYENNIVARADYLFNIQWTPLKNLYGWCSDPTITAQDKLKSDVFEVGKQYHIPYGQPTTEGEYIEFNGFSVRDFITATKNIENKFYNTRSYAFLKNDKGEIIKDKSNSNSVLYALDCSGFAAFCWSLPNGTKNDKPGTSNWSTGARKDIMKGLDTVAENLDNLVDYLEPGDVLNSISSKHIVVVTAVNKKDKTIEITEMTPPQMKRTVYDIAGMKKKFTKANWTIYRLIDIDSVPLPPVS